VEIKRVTVSGFSDYPLFTVDRHVPAIAFSFGWVCNGVLVQIPDGVARAMSSIPALAKLRDDMFAGQAADKIAASAAQGGSLGDALGILLKEAVGASQPSATDWDHVKSIPFVDVYDEGTEGTVYYRLFTPNDRLFDKLRIGRTAAVSVRLFGMDGGTLLGILVSVRESSGMKCPNGHVFDGDSTFRFCPEDGLPLSQE
jgi:hypothetical protein